MLLQVYYAAFFAAHGLMRACGEAVLKLERAQADVLQISSDAALTPSDIIEPSMYSLPAFASAALYLAALSVE
ncbi:MAG: hypothetical protein ACT6QM_15830, partial [Brevundimonas mediterranea]